MTTPGYLNAALPVDERVADLMGRMDIDEKLSQLGAVGLPDLITDERLDEDAALAVIPHGIGQVTRIGATTSLMPWESARLYNQLQTARARTDPARDPDNGPRRVPRGLLRPGRHRLPSSTGAGLELGPSTGPRSCRQS